MCDYSGDINSVVIHWLCHTDTAFLPDRDSSVQLILFNLCIPMHIGFSIQQLTAESQKISELVKRWPTGFLAHFKACYHGFAHGKIVQTPETKKFRFLDRLWLYIIDFKIIIVDY